MSRTSSEQLQNRQNMDTSRPRNRLLLALFLILSASFIGTGLLNYTLTRETVHQEILLKGLPLTRDNIYSDLTSELTGPIMVASSMATDTFLKEWAETGERDLARITRYLAEIQRRYQFFSTFFVSATTGKYYHYKGLHKVVSKNDAHDVWFYDFLESEKEHQLDVDTDEAGNNILTVFVNYKIFSRGGTLLGVTGVGLKMDILAGMVTEYQKKYDRSIYLIDTDGVVQVHRNRAYVDRVNIRDLEGIGEHASEIVATGDAPRNFEFVREGSDILLTVRYIGFLDWLLCVEQNETRTLAAARRNVLRTVGTGIAATIVVIFLTLLTINSYQRRVEQMATTDFLTGVSNRRILDQEFRRATSRYSRTGQPFSVILVDLDGFKAVNDQLGHIVGDQVLRDIASLIQDVVRPTDVVARWGGDEFVIMTDLLADGAAGMAERIRGAVADSGLGGGDRQKDDPRDRITVSCGVCGYSQGDSLDRLLLKADQALYRSKEDGRNRVVVHRG